MVKLQKLTLHIIVRSPQAILYLVIPFITTQNLFHTFRCDVLCMHLRASPSIRLWFGLHMLFNHMNRFCEYLLSCPSNEVRSAFMKLVVLLAHFSIKDPPCPCPQGISNPDVNANLSDHVIWALLALLQREVSEHGRHLPHYCSVFHMYANQGK